MFRPRGFAISQLFVAALFVTGAVAATTVTHQFVDSGAHAETEQQQPTSTEQEKLARARAACDAAAATGTRWVEPKRIATSATSSQKSSAVIDVEAEKMARRDEMEPQTLTVLPGVPGEEKEDAR